MPNEVKKLELIEKILHTSDDGLLNMIEKIISDGVAGKSSAKGFKQFSGQMTDEEADTFEKNIVDGCENISPDDWN